MERLKKITLGAVLAALLCILAPLAIPVGEIPITLATFAVYLISCAVKPRYALPAVAIYILLGAVGLPVFSGFTGGLQKLLGVTGGYILGYLPCCAVITFLTARMETRKWVYPMSMLLGTALCYLCGTAWFVAQTGNRLGAALSICVLPFLPGDAAKIIAASAVGIPLRRRLQKIA